MTQVSQTQRGGGGPNSPLSTVFQLLRVSQWLKNLMLFFPPFLAGEILRPGLAQRGVLPFVSFCLASSATYIFNDIIDRDKDLHHPAKRRRPIPAGRVPLPAAYAFAAALLVTSLILGFQISYTFVMILLAYLVVASSYTLKLKGIPLVDLFCISAGFLFRLQAGGAAFGIAISEWLFLSVFLLSIFLSTGKRLCEKNSMGESAPHHRKSLEAYPPGFLEGALYLTGAAVLVTYAMYVIPRHGLVYTVPLCCFGLLRYALRVVSGFGGDPTESLLKDAPLFVVGLLWVVMVGWGIYGR